MEDTKKTVLAGNGEKDVPRAVYDGVLTIDVDAQVESMEEQEEARWHQLLNAHRTRKILTGQLGGIEKLESGWMVAVTYFNGFRIIIPMNEMMINLQGDGRENSDTLNRQVRIANNMLGCDIDFIIKDLDNKSRSVVASRKDAMLKKRQTFYIGEDAEKPMLYEGRIVEARVIAVAPKAVRLEVFGVEVSVRARDMAWEWMVDAGEKFQVGDLVLVMVNKVEASSVDQIIIEVDAKSPTANINKDNLRKCHKQGKYTGIITEVYKGTYFIRLDIGVNAVAHSCNMSALPGKKDKIGFLSGLTAERIGLNALEAFLPGKQTYPEEVYVVCSRILRTYGNLSIRIDGKERLEECMNEKFEVKNVKTFLTLFPFRDREPAEWHYIDLTEEKWDPLVKKLSAEEFEECVTDTLEGKTYSTKDLIKYLERYEILTGKKYQDIFWENSQQELYTVFNRLILHGVLSEKNYLEEFVVDYKNEDPDLKKKWKFMAGYLKKEMEGLCNEHSYRMLKFLIDEIGLDGCELLSPWMILKETFSLGYYDIQRKECEFFSPLLGKEEHRELFSMVEKKLFYEHPDIYPEYLTSLLLKDSTALWMEQSESYEISRQLLPLVSNSYQKEILYQKYMTEEDRKRYRERKEWIKEQQKRMERWKTEKNIKQQFNQMLRENRKTDKEIQSIYEFYRNGRYSYDHKKLYCKIVSSYLRDDFARTEKKTMVKKEIMYFLKLAETMYQDECMELPEITGLMEKAEVE